MNNNVNTIKIFQLRAARSVLGIKVRELGECLGVSGAAISLWEHKGIDANLKTSDINITLLRKFFEQHEIFFPNENTISLNPTLTDNGVKSTLTRFQLRAGRTILNLSQAKFATCIGVSAALITRAEDLNNKAFIRPKDHNVTLKIRNWLENNGIYFPNNLSISFKKIQKNNKK